jgi:hypothetical protein
MPRFSLKQLLLSTTEIAVGMIGFAWALCIIISVSLSSYAMFLLLWHFSGGCIGAGIFGLFNKSRLGFALGMITAFVIYVCIVISIDY